jgi:hypothetical protein
MVSGVEGDSERTGWDGMGRPLLARVSTRRWLHSWGWLAPRLAATACMPVPVRARDLHGPLTIVPARPVHGPVATQPKPHLEEPYGLVYIG